MGFTEIENRLWSNGEKSKQTKGGGLLIFRSRDGKKHFGKRKTQMKASHIKKLDQLWSEKVKERAGWKCEHCLEEGYELHPGYGVWLNASHIIGRRYRGSRWLLDNGLCLCYVCHRQYDEHGPLERDIFRRCVGKERYARLRKVKQEVAKYQDYEEIKRSLE